MTLQSIANSFIIAGQIFTDKEIFWFTFTVIAVFAFISFLFGSSIASFLGVAAERPLRGESLNGRSHCACGRKLKWHENIPVFGWIKTLGKAKCCGSIIPKRYVISETSLGLVYALASPSFVFFMFGVVPRDMEESTLLSWFAASAVLAIGGTIVTFMMLRSHSKREAEDKTSGG